jgi:formylglycine-generating enzyme
MRKIILWILGVLLFGSPLNGAGSPLNGAGSPLNGAGSPLNGAGAAGVSHDGSSRIGKGAMSTAPSQSRKRISTEGMVRIPSGYYRPFFITKGIDSVKIESFFMDSKPVTNKEFLEFVKANPNWAPSAVSQLFAEKGYLKQWKNDFEIGDLSMDDAPVVNVSWFAAHAYAQWRGKRLPTIAEWEYASLAPIVKPYSASGQAKNELILDWYCKPNADHLPPAGTVNRNAYGVCDMFGQVWEWVEDYGSVMLSTDPQSSPNLGSLCGAGAIGSIDPTDYATFMRFAMRNSLKGNYVLNNLGFRCVRN